MLVLHLEDRIMDIFFRILMVFLVTSSIFAREEIDSCNCEAARIFNSYQHLKNKFIDSAWKRLLISINKDSVLKKQFLSEDSSNLKKLELNLVPIMKLDYEARKYHKGENLCRYFVFDTLNFDSQAFFSFHQSIIFSIYPGHNDSDIESLILCESLEVCRKEKFHFYKYDEKQHDYQSINDQFHRLIMIMDTSFVFFIEGLTELQLNNGRIIIYNYDDNYRKFSNEPNKYIDNFYSERWINYLAIRCSLGGVPWWRFWDWKIFHPKPVFFQYKFETIRQ
jgi:hypothetical protein